MQVNIKADHDNQLTIHTVTGEPSFQDSMATFKNFYEGKPTQNVLWDFRKASLARISTKEIEAVLYYVQRHVEKRKGGKTAVLVSKNLEYGISRMVQALTEIKDIPLKIEIFRSIEEAMQWLGKEE